MIKVNNGLKEEMGKHLYICTYNVMSAHLYLVFRETLKMVNVPKLYKTCCPHPKCKAHNPFKVTQYKKSAESKLGQGRRR